MASARSTRRSARPASTVAPPAAWQACAEQVLEVVPSVMDALRVAMRQHVGDQLSVPQFRCLAFIARTPGAPVGAVATFLGVTMPTASAMVDRLVRAGAVQHDVDPADRRRGRLRITPAGRTQLQGIRCHARDDLARMLAGRGDSDLHTLQAGLAMLHQVFCQGPAIAAAPADDALPPTATLQAR